tara:strand:+ start:1507 stop:2370 length:864 start_codon:yes stop_codon:yes gene_type:complete
LNNSQEIEIAFIGGSGLSNIKGFNNFKWIEMSSKYGNPSSKVCVGMLNKKKIAFLPRHGPNHNIPPTKINYRANIEILKQLNVKNIISISAVGSLREDYKPGEFILVDQFIDYTKRRESSFFDEDIVAHVEFSKPICENLHKISSNILEKLCFPYHTSGKYICIEGPQFSTFAESQLFRSWGCDVIGMTNMPECKLSREAGICYTSLCMVTDYDCWHQSHESVTVDNIIKTLKENSEKANHFIDEITKEDKIACSISSESVLKDAIITNLEEASQTTKSKLKYILPR